nr:MAG TPA: hypothetical protein [Caudoviricetes sp.]
MLFTDRSRLRAVLYCVRLFYTNYYFLNCAVYRKM